MNPRACLLGLATVSLATQALARRQEEPVAEEPVSPDEPSPSRPPKPNMVVIWGTVRAAGSSEGLIEAEVQVLGTKYKTRTDVDGRYRLELPPGTYALRVYYELHRARRVEHIKAQVGTVSQIDIALDPDKKSEEEVVRVEAEPERANAATQTLLRKNAAAASDAVSAQDIARTPDRNAADAARRVVGATIVDGRYIYVRGLGERYTNALLNGTPLPSPEPDRQAVPLDLFPALVLSDLTVMKTFTPDMPGDFAGGSVRVHTRDLPTKLFYQVSLQGGFNTQATFAKRLSYPGGSLDWLGIDDGKRKLPGEFPDRVVGSDPNLTNLGRAINSPRETERAFTLPNLGVNAVFGAPILQSSDKKHALGAMAAGSYSRRFVRRTDEVIRTFAPNADGTLRRLNDYLGETGTDLVAASALLDLAYRYETGHKLTLTTVYSRSAENEARAIGGFNEERGANITDTRLRFVSRALTFTQLRGEHAFKKDANLDWSLSFSQASLLEPNTRQTVYTQDPRFGFDFTEATLSGSHFYAGQSERTWGGGLNVTRPLTTGDTPTSIKVGGLFNLRSRDFSARRFRFMRVRGTDPAVYSQPAGTLFQNDNVGRVLELTEFTNPNDAYVAGQDVLSAYAMADVYPVPKLRVTLGERVEAANQSLDSFDPFAATLSRTSTSLKKVDLLPAVSAVYKLSEKQNLRAAFSRTVARPQLRELAPFAFADYFGAREVLGNPKLDRTRIANLDLRYEYFFGGADVVGLSAFYKSFRDPIEQVIIPTSRGVISFENAKGAENVGLELEARKGLGFLWKALSDLTLVSNLTLVRSRVELDARSGVQTSRERPLAGQSPYILNAALDYAREKEKLRCRLLYNVFGARIAQVGSEGLPDVYERPRSQLDLTAAKGFGEHVEVKVSVENLLNAPYRMTHGSEGSDVVSEFRIGTTAWLGASYTQ